MKPRAPAAASTSADVRDLSLRTLSRLLRERELSAREVVAAHLDRIAQVNPVVNAICTLDPERAVAAADRADERAASGADLPRLHGVPMTHKESHDVAGMRGTLGSPVYADRIATEDSPVVARLRAAGVISTGKSNVPELSAGSHTFNPLFGTTTNPYDPTRSAGGSSGGVAAAVAAGIQPAGDASDMGGSIRTPASFCNLVGLRPSLGRVPVGDDPWAWLVRRGGLARTVDDLRLLLETIEGPHPTSALPAYPRLPVGPALASGDVRGLRIGVSLDLGLGLPVEAPTLDAVSRQAELLQRLGASVEPGCPDLRDADEVFTTLRAMDFAASYHELYEQHREQLRPDVRQNIELGLRLGGRDLWSLAAARTRLHRATTAFFEHHDVLVGPAVQVQPFDATWAYPTVVAGEPMADYLSWMRAATVVSATGLPAMSVPAGFDDDGLPVGVQLVGPHGSDDRLLAVAEALENHGGHHDRRPDEQVLGG